jgi:NADPH2:quinone reductase
MKAVWVHGKTQMVKELPIPEPGEGQVLIKVVCAAQNPKDWKGSFVTRGLLMLVPELVGAPAAVQGSDISGTIAKVGPGVTRVFPNSYCKE